MVPLNTANLLTLSRIVMVPLMLVLLFGDQVGPFPLAAAVFGLAALTDAADGHVARTRNMITDFGRLADPFADKLLVGAALASLVIIGRLPLWIALVVGVREVAVTLLRWHAARRGVVISASPLGKAKTGVQMTAILVLMLVTDASAGWIDGVLFAVVALTVASGVQYGLAYARRRAAVPAGAVGLAG